MRLVTYRNESEPERVDKTLVQLSEIEGSLRSPTSIITPVFTVQGQLDMPNLATLNYIYVPDFKRYYFVTDVRGIRTGLWEISARVDVLTSFKDQIRAQKAIIRRQENAWNLYLNDGSFRVYQNPTIVTKPFPSGFGPLEFVLAVAGN